MPSKCWPETDDARKRPVLVLTKGASQDKAILDLVLQTESGVYGYHKVVSVSISFDSEKTVSYQTIGQLEFSDFGSWARVSPHDVLLWDAEWEQGPHEGPHPYRITWYRSIDGKYDSVTTKRTRKSYNIGWSTSSTRPAYISAKNDPLSEWGLKWRWWGDGHSLKRGFVRVFKN